MPSVGRRRVGKVRRVESMERNRQRVIIIDEDEEVSETSNSSGSDYIPISEGEGDEDGENYKEGSDRQGAPRIKRFMRSRNEAPVDVSGADQVNGSSEQVAVEDSESDCEVLSAVEWDKIFSKRKNMRTAEAGKSLRKERGLSFEKGDPMLNELGRKSLGTTLRRAKHAKKSSASVKVEASSSALNGSSSPGLQDAQSTWTTQPVKPFTPNRVPARRSTTEDLQGSPENDEASASRAAQTIDLDSDRASPERPVELPRPVSAGAPRRKAPHIVHTPETSKAAEQHAVLGDTALKDGVFKAKGTSDSETHGHSPDTTDLESASKSATALDRETRRQSAEFREAEKLEWAARQLELQKQALEVQKEKERLRRKRKEAEKQLEMQSRQKQRVLEIRESQKKEEQVMGMKEELRGIVQLELEQRTANCTDMGSLLQRLGILGACLPSVEQVNAGYKKALKTFHPDRASGNGDLRCQVEAEETFKLISRLKSRLPLVTVRK